MELDELLKEARMRYPVGTRYMTIAEIPIIKTIESEVEWSYTNSFIIDKNGYVIYIASSNKWAEIVSVPVIHSPYVTKLLKKLGVK